MKNVKLDLSYSNILIKWRIFIMNYMRNQKMKMNF